MTTELEIKFDGETPAIRAHRLSIGELGEPLRLLLAALRRTATLMAKNAIDDGTKNPGGRYTVLAAGLDLQISAIKDGCVRIVTEATHTPGPKQNAEMWFTREAVTRLLEDIEHEAHDRPRSIVARAYLASLPPSVSTQEYVCRQDGEVVKEVSIGKVTIPAPPADAPRVLRRVCAVAGAQWDSDHESVTLVVDEKRTRFTASAELVERALAMRNTTVRATVLDAKVPRLLRLDAVDAPDGMPAERITGHIMERWAGVLERLAK